MASGVTALANAGLVSVDSFIHDQSPLSQEARGVLLAKVIGILHTSHNRPPVTLVFKEENLPHPSEIAMYKGEDSEYADTQMPENPDLARVSSFIRRRLADDAYILHLHPTRSFFFVITGAPRHPLLDAELERRINTFVQNRRFPVYLWTSQDSAQTPKYYEQAGPECTFYGDQWSATLRLCDDCAVRPTRWEGITLPSAYTEKKLAVVGSNARPMLIVPRRVERGGGCVIRPLKDYENACARASPPAERGCRGLG